jgi:serine phosphatase RsbU (regulator of sigma subunit)
MIVVIVLSTILSWWGEQPIYADEIADLQARLDTAKGKYRVHVIEQIYYQSLESDDLDYQYRCVNDLINEAKRQKNDTTEANALGERTVFFFNNAMDDSVLTVTRRDMERVKELQQWPVFYKMWWCVANTYVFMGRNNIAIRETQAMFEDAKKRNDKLGMGQANCIMGQAYSNLRNFDQSIDVFEKSLSELSSIRPMPIILPDVYVYYGEALNDKKDYAKLKQLTVKWSAMLQKFIKENELHGNPTGDIYWSYYYLACAQADLGLGKTDEASKNLTEARKYIKSNMDTQLGGKWYYCSAQLATLQGQYEEALNYNNLGAKNLLAGNDSAVQVAVDLQRAEILEKMGRYAEAAHQYRDTYFLNDSLNAQETRGQLVEMNSIFQVGEKELENERLQRENERARHENEKAHFRFIIIVTSVILFSLVVFLFIRIRSARRLKQAHVKLQTAYGDLRAANEVIEQTTAAKERIESELRIASDIQMSMVPTIFPDRPGLDIYASMTPAKEVGGDMYSYLLVEETNKLYFALGDVSGKGVPASLFMAQATRLFHTLAKQQLPPAEVATRMNGELAEDNEQSMFITMFIGLLDLSNGHLDFCNAGHNPPVIISPNPSSPTPSQSPQSVQFLQMEANAPVGLWPELDYVGEEIENISGTPLFIYTDGLNEAENRQHEQFTDNRLLEILGTTPFESSQQTVELLRSEVESFRDGADPSDDLTIMCVYLKTS